MRGSEERFAELVGFGEVPADRRRDRLLTPEGVNGILKLLVGCAESDQRGD